MSHISTGPLDSTSSLFEATKFLSEIQTHTSTSPLLETTTSPSKSPTHTSTSPSSQSLALAGADSQAASAELRPTTVIPPSLPTPSSHRTVKSTVHVSNPLTHSSTRPSTEPVLSSLFHQTSILTHSSSTTGNSSISRDRTSSSLLASRTSTIHSATRTSSSQSATQTSSQRPEISQSSTKSASLHSFTMSTSQTIQTSSSVMSTQASSTSSTATSSESASPSQILTQHLDKAGQTGRAAYIITGFVMFAMIIAGVMWKKGWLCFRPRKDGPLDEEIGSFEHSHPMNDLTSSGQTIPAQPQRRRRKRRLPDELTSLASYDNLLNRSGTSITTTWSMIVSAAKKFRPSAAAAAPPPATVNRRVPPPRPSRPSRSLSATLTNLPSFLTVPARAHTPVVVPEDRVNSFVATTPPVTGPRFPTPTTDPKSMGEGGSGGEGAGTGGWRHAELEREILEMVRGKEGGRI